MAEISSLPLPDLLIDAENPRLPQPNVGQREAMRSLAADEPPKLMALARDILAHGMNIAEFPIVMPLEDDLKRFIVLEGNRRLLALKGLENPEWLVGAIPISDVEEMRRLSKQYQDDPIEAVQCVVVATREEARHWILIRHTGGQNSGASVVPWTSDDAARFRARTGNFEFHTQALNLLEAAGQLTPAKRRKVKATSLKRLLGTPEVRTKIGIESEDGQLKVLGDEKRVIKALLHIVNDLDQVKVSQIYTQQQRIDYANNLPTNLTVSANVPTSTSTAGKRTAHSRASASRTMSPRDKLIPSRCALNVTEPRLQAIARELKKLSLSQHPNAVSVLLRVFVELSVDTYIHSKKLIGITDADVFHKKLTAVCNDLVARKKLTTQQAKPVRRAAAKDSFLAPSIDMMHSYIHCQYIFPTGTDLRAHWDGLESFILAVWAP
ncbi:MAG: hypothetical protein WCA10_07220 [Terracidiphilus sp.]